MKAGLCILSKMYIQIIMPIWSNTKMTNIQITTPVYSMLIFGEKKVARYLNKGWGPSIIKQAIMIALSKEKRDSLSDMELLHLINHQNHSGNISPIVEDIC